DKLAALDPRSRLPLVALALPALKQLSSAQYKRFKQCLGQLILADKQISLMEWALYGIVVHNIEPPPRRPHKTALGNSRDACQGLLSALVHAAHMDASQSHTAFNAAASILPFKAMKLLPRDGVSAATLEPAVIHLSNLASSDK